MSDYSDKSFKELYSEVVEYVKTLTTKWDPTVADEADPGVAILKASCLLFDKVNYRQNYRNSQNSVRDVSDPVEGEKLFYDLGYHLKKKKSATGNISVKYLHSASNDYADIPIFTQFSDKNSSITFTSVRKMSRVEKGKSILVEVQEGVPVRHQYLGRRIFTDLDITSNLRLPLPGYSDLASNGVIICSASRSELEGGEELEPLVSDWLNVSDNIFTAVETSNVFSIHRDSSGENYIQFYEDSLVGLSNGIKIWVLSSSGSAGNISSGKLSQLYSSSVSLDSSEFVISHNEFTNGQDKESLSSAMNNYYNSYGVNDSLVSSRDYSHIVESIVGPNLERISSKALISDVSGKHNVVEVLSKLSSGGDSRFVRYATSALVSGILVNALSYSDDYYESFKLLDSPDTLNFIKKAIFGKNVLSNDISLAGDDESIYTKYLFDFSDLAGTVTINSSDKEETVRENIKLAISKAFNSRNLVAGEMVSESSIAEAVKSGVDGVVDCYFYYKKHMITKVVPPRPGTYLTADEKADVVSRSVLRGDLPLFDKDKVSVPIGAYLGSDSVLLNNSPWSGGIISLPQGDKKISKLSGTFNLDSIGSQNLKANEFIQFYKEAVVDSQTYGFGVKPLLLYPQTKLDEEVTYSDSTSSMLLGKSVIAAGSVLSSVPGKKYNINGKEFNGISIDLVSEDDGPDSPLPFYYSTRGNGREAVVARRDYVVQDYMAFDTSSSSPSSLAKGSVIRDGSYIEGKYHYSLSIENGEVVDFTSEKYKLAVLRLKTGDKDTDFVEINYKSEPNIVRLENFSGNLNSNGSIDQPGEWGDGFVAETIVTLIPDSTHLELSGKFKYGLITNHDFSDEDDKGVRSYLLGEDEHFIYSDQDLLDFVDFGSGTLISIPEGHTFSELSNRVSLDRDLSRQLEDLPLVITIKNTEIFTFSPGSGGEVVELRYKKSDYSNLSNEWVKVGASGIRVKQGDVEQSFDDTYMTRIGLILKSGYDKTLQLSRGQKLIIEYSDDTSDTLDIASNEETYLSMSEPLYLNSATNLDLSEYDLKIKVYGVKLSGLSNNFAAILKPFDPDTGFTYEQSLVSKSDEISHFSMVTNDSAYTMKVVNKTNGRVLVKSGAFDSNSDGGAGNFTDDTNNKVGLIGHKPYTSSGNNESVLPAGSSGYVYIPRRSDGKGDKSGIKFYVEPGGSEGTIVISSQSRISGFNKDLFFTDGNESEKFEQEYGNTVLEKVTKLSTGNSTGSLENPAIEFDFDYVGESQLKNPTEAVKYYDNQHILNKNILTVINLEELDNNIKIVRRNR